MPNDKLVVTGDLAYPLDLTVVDIRANYPSAVVTTQFETDNGLITSTFIGARLWDVIASAGSPSGELYVEAKADDGWGCIIRRDELDPALTDRVVLVAYERDGAPLPPRDGLLRLVVPGDGPGRRFVRGLAYVNVVIGYPPADAD